MVRGSIWAVGWRWTIRFIGLISTIILARLLTPADFGLVAMAMVVIGFIEVFSETGERLALLRLTNPVREHYDAAWTLQIIIAIVITLVIVASAPLARIYFGDPRVENLIYFLSLRAFFGGFENIGVVAFRANLDFSKDFRFGVYQKLITFFLGVVFSLWLRNYWALAIAIVSARVISTALSYRLHPFRPRISFERMGDILSFSLWTLLTQIGDFLSNKLDEFAVGGYAGTTSMGNYAVASDFAAAPTVELVVPMTRGLFPVYSHFQADRARLRNAYVKVLSVVATLAIPTSIGVSLVAHDLVEVVLGPKWQAAASLIVWLAIGSAGVGLTDGVLTIFAVVGRPKISSTIVGLRTFFLAPAIAFGGYYAGIEGIAMARAFIYIASLPILFYAIRAAIPLYGKDILAQLWRPLVAGLIMAAAVEGLHSPALGLAVLRLAMDVLLGAAVFMAADLLLWRMSGRPEGVEQIFVDQALNLMPRLRQRT